MNQAKKQNRILLAVLVATLAVAAVLLALTGSANRKKEESKLPPAVEEKAEESAPAEKSPSLGRQNPAKAALPEEKADGGKKDAQPDEKTDAEAETEEPAVETASDSVLPRFVAPVDGYVLKECSLAVPVFSNTMNDYRTHAGLDFACSPGTPVCAAADGVICEASRDPMMGVTISIRHAGGAMTTYQGLSEESLEMSSAGQAVSAGQAIGSSGSTALIESAEEDHLHFELSVNGVHEDPADYMDVKLLARQPED